MLSHHITSKGTIVSLLVLSGILIDYTLPVVKVGIFYSGNAFKAAFQCVPPTPETKEVVDEVP